MTGQDVAQIARTYVGTRFVHQARLKGVGIDCVGVLVGVCREAGIEVRDRTGYGIVPDPKILAEALEEHLIPLPSAVHPPTGSVGAFWITKPERVCHVGVFVGRDRFVHAVHRRERVIEDLYGPFWAKRLAQIWLIPGVDYTPAAPNLPQWPWMIRKLAQRRKVGQRGAGDTLKEELGADGETFKRWMKRLGIDCGCEARQAWMNARFPYEV